jgi:DNA-directed RNA polymerase specialized sigma24 family protein
VFARASEFRPGAPVLPWFYAVVANEVRAAARRLRRDGLGEGLGDELADASTPERSILRAELEHALAGAIAGLEPDAAEAIA